MGWKDAPLVEEAPQAPAWQSAPVVEDEANSGTAPAHDAGIPQAPPPPSTLDVAMNAVPKGIANLANTPHTINSLVMRGLANLPGIEHLPQVKGFLEGIADNPEFLRNRPMELMEKIGLVDPAKNPQTGPQRIVDAAIQTAIGAAAIPAGGAMGALQGAAMGAASGTASQITKEATGSDLLASVSGAIPPLTPIGWKAAMAFGKKPIINASTQELVNDARKAGYVLEPSAVRTPTSVAESISGKASIAQEASLRNQKVTNVLAAKSLGLPAETELSPAVLDEIRKRAYEPYEQVAKLIPGQQLQGLKVRSSVDRDMLPGPVTGLSVKKSTGEPVTTGQTVQELRDADGKLLGLKVSAKSHGEQVPLEGMKGTVVSRGQDVPGPLQGMRMSVEETRGGIPLEELKQARNDASAFYRHYDRSADPASLKAAQAASARAKELEAQIDESLTRMGRPDLMSRLIDARKLIARTYDVERALNVGTNNVSAPVIGRMLKDKVPLSDELETIGKFAQAFPRVTRAVEGVPPPAVSGTDAAMSAILAAGGATASGNIFGAALGTLPLLRIPARKLVLSNMYQNGLLRKPMTMTLHPLGRAAMGAKPVLDQEESP